MIATDYAERAFPVILAESGELPMD